MNVGDKVVPKAIQPEAEVIQVYENEMLIKWPSGFQQLVPIEQFEHPRPEEALKRLEPYTHILTLSIGVDNVNDWDSVYQLFSGTARELGPQYPYVSMSSNLTSDEN